MRIPVLALGSVLVPVLAASLGSCVAAQDTSAASSGRDRQHNSDQWRLVEQHLPDPATASAQTLEIQADILRARRFPEDALDYYRYALARGGNQPELLNKIGLTQLEMRNMQLARSYFQRVIKLRKKDANAWNNLGAVEYIDGFSANAVSDYKKAVKLDRRDAVYHANLATAYFEQKEYKGARKEIATAIKLDAHIFEHPLSNGGVAAHVLSAQERARFCFEMAKLYAQSGLEEEMLRSLALASEAGIDVQREMRGDPMLAKFEMDPRVVVLVHNAQALRASRASAANALRTAGDAVPALPEAKPVAE
jgi:Flp pilus assembly protein TadD